MNPSRARVAVIGLPAALVVLGLAGPGWAHGQLRPGQVAAGSTVDLVLEVPSEREGYLSSRIALSVPAGLAALDCRSPLGWTCAVGGRSITWDRVTGSAEDFAFTLRVGARTGTYLLPLVQTYEDGETSDFSGPAGRSDEAPRLVVTGAAPRANVGARTPAPTSSGQESRPVAASSPAGGVTEGSPTASPSDVAVTSPRPSLRVASSAAATGSPSPPESAQAVVEVSRGRGVGLLALLGALAAVALVAVALWLGAAVRRRPGR